ncbi:MAG TPA: hypothetical protein VEY07_06410 [Thermoplasmata archaeon]|nr:hypothetical protein [Thermoplasmata archaeon]
MGPPSTGAARVIASVASALARQASRSSRVDLALAADAASTRNWIREPARRTLTYSGWSAASACSSWAATRSLG